MQKRGEITQENKNTSTKIRGGKNSKKNSCCFFYLPSDCITLPYTSTPNLFTALISDCGRGCQNFIIWGISRSSHGCLKAIPGALQFLFAHTRWKCNSNGSQVLAPIHDLHSWHCFVKQTFGPELIPLATRRREDLATRDAKLRCQCQCPPAYKLLAPVFIYNPISNKPQLRSHKTLSLSLHHHNDNNDIWP